MKKITLVLLTLISIGIFWTCKDEELPEVIGNNKIELIINEDSTSYVFVQLTCALSEMLKFTVEQYGFCWDTVSSVTIEKQMNSFGNLTSQNFQKTIESLISNKTYYIKAYIQNGDVIIYSNELPIYTKDARPIVTTNDIVNIMANKAESGGNVTAYKELFPITQRGICWAKTQNPTIADSITTNGTGNGSFTSKMQNLDIGISYYARAYAINSEGINYGNEKTFSTLDGIPELNTDSITNITATSATLYGNIIENDGLEILEKGFCWNISSNPTIENSTQIVTGNTLGSFNSEITGLEINTTYFVKAYLKNSKGEFYSNDEISYTTLDGKPTITISGINNITDSSTVCALIISDDGGLSLNSIGICWDINSNPDILDNHKTLGNAIGNYETTINKLSAETNYYIKAFATNNLDTFYSNEQLFTTMPTPTFPVIVTLPITNITAMSAESGGEITSDGYSSITEKGICWSTTDMPTITDNKNNEGIGTDAFASIMSGLATSTVYFVRAYAINKVGISYGNSISFTTTDGKPEVETQVTTNITPTSADLNGNVLSDGGFSITQNGVCWSSTNTDPTLADNIENASTPRIGSFTIPFSSTVPSTYYFKAYATNEKGTSYGSVESFVITGTPLLNEVTDDEVFDGRGIPLKGTGNGDALINVGEDIDFRITIKNNGTADAYNINAVLEIAWAPDNNICNISDNNCTLTTLAIGTEDDLDYFDFQISGLPPDDPNNQLFFKMIVTYEDISGNTYEYIFTDNEEINKRIYP